LLLRASLTLVAIAWPRL